MKPMGNLAANAIFDGLRGSAGKYGDDQALLQLGAVLLRTSEACAAFDGLSSTPHPATDKGKYT